MNMVHLCHNFSLGLVINAKACKGAGQELTWESHLMLSGMQKSVREWTPTLPNELPLWFKPHLNRRHTQKYGPPKLREFLFKEFRNSNLGVLGQNDIWLLALWPCTKKIIKGKVVASLKSELWWVLWVHVYPWFIRAPKVFQLCINQLVVWFM
jgi:hypothetical protein